MPHTNSWQTSSLRRRRWLTATPRRYAGHDTRREIRLPRCRHWVTAHAEGSRPTLSCDEGRGSGGGVCRHYEPRVDLPLVPRGATAATPLGQPRYRPSLSRRRHAAPRHCHASLPHTPRETAIGMMPLPVISQLSEECVFISLPSSRQAAATPQSFERQNTPPRHASICRQH